MEASSSQAGGGGTSGTATFSTPPRKATFNAEAGPSRTAPQGTSPAYSSRRHSLYGIEDRIVIDPGSRIWKVGFSGEADPRAVFWTGPGSGPSGELWDLDIEALGAVDRDEAERLVGARITSQMREVFSKYLLTDAKSRKVIVLENAFLPEYIKQLVAQALFENLKVPSVSFTPSPLLALVACGRITGLVIDCGWLETTVTPVYFSRPLYHYARSTPLAGRALHRRLKSLIRRFGTYHAPPTSMSDLSRRPVSPVPADLLIDDLIERIITEACFVAEPISAQIPASADIDMLSDIEESHLATLRSRYTPRSQATDLAFPVVSPSKGLGPGKLVVPGWIRERASEVLFEDDEEHEAESVTEATLQCLLSLPTDLRPALGSSILVCGGTASLPGFITRLRISLRAALRHEAPPPSTFPLHTPAQRQMETKEWKRRAEEPYRSIHGLVDKIAILNDPSPLDGDGGDVNAGSAPRWIPSLLPWIGGSLAGALKTGGPEIQREEYDTMLSESISRGEQFAQQQDEEHAEAAALAGIELESLRPGEANSVLEGRKRRKGWRDTVPLGDWTRPNLVKTA